jgi:hypothetical protein
LPGCARRARRVTSRCSGLDRRRRVILAGDRIHQLADYQDDPACSGCSRGRRCGVCSRPRSCAAAGLIVAESILR